MDNIKQFKLTSGEEIICEVVEWADEETSDLVIRKALKIFVMDNDQQGIRYYNFKPWMTLSEGEEVFIALNSNHIVAESNPTAKTLKYFYEAVENQNLSEEEIAKKIEDYVEKMKARIESALDEDENDNIIRFNPNRDKLH